MEESVTRKKTHFDIYEYVSNLEEEVKALQLEKRIVHAKHDSLEQQLRKIEEEVSSIRGCPLVVGTVLESLPEHKAIVKNTAGMEFVVKCPEKFLGRLSIGQRVALSQKNLTIIELLPESGDNKASAMEIIDRPKVSFSDIGGLKDVITELEEAVVLPLKYPERLEALGIEAPTGILLYGEPGTGKTLLAKAVANETKSTFISLTASELARKFIGEGARLVRNVFRLARKKAPAVIFIDEIDAVAAHRYSTANGDREVQRTLMQLLAEMDGFRSRDGVVIIAATNRLDIVDPALLRPGRFDRVIEVPVPELEAREKIFKIQSGKMKLGKLDFKKLAAETEGATGADIRAICTEAGIFALRSERASITQDDFTQAVEKVLGHEIEGDERKMFS